MWFLAIQGLERLRECQDVDNVTPRKSTRQREEGVVRAPVIAMFCCKLLIQKILADLTRPDLQA